MKRSILIVCALGFAILLVTIVSRAGDSPDKSAGNRPPTAVRKIPKVREMPVFGTGEAAIEAALAQRVPCEFVETPLKDVIEYLRDALKIEIWLDEAGLKDAGVDPEAPVTCNLRSCRVANVLDVILNKLELTWTIHDDVLWITSPTKAESFTEARTYDVADLVVYRDDKGSQVDDYEPLIDLVTDLAAPTWDHNGGRGSVRGATLGTAKVLLVVQTHEIHHQIADLLSQIRAAAAKNSGEGIPRRVSPRRRGDTDKQPSARATNQSS